jgi:hypothetical protein
VDHQGGNITDAGRAAGDRFHAIAGRGVYWNKAEKRYNDVKEMRDATLELGSQL